MPIDTLNSVWKDQADFNTHFREAPAPTFEQRTADTKELVLHLISECDELLRASGAWKPHRRETVRENPRAVLTELIDIFKYTVSIAQVHGFTVDDFLAMYWEKSMVVRQRYSQEFVQTLDRPFVIVDIDNVLADYIQDFVQWAYNKRWITTEIVVRFRDRPQYVDANSLGVSSSNYEKMKHEYRISGRHADLSLMPGTSEFMAWLKSKPWGIILLTARPIDKYPNLYGETLRWVLKHNLPGDFIWWARDKGQFVMEKGVVDQIVFAVDDEEGFAWQLSQQGIVTYHLTTTPHIHAPSPTWRPVRLLSDIIALNGDTA